ncbi:mite group 2 allergen Tyr p 2-like [Chironomus tepperi]|uniref:mite group 2 allergen Tyr p 2-like n=1 Tax=Chironomus tepperi TaxID=113505 RepID=UPI00391F5453
MKGKLAILILFSLLAVVSLTDIQFHSCGDKDIYNDLSCTINRVAIEGCGASSGRECRLKRGFNASMVVDFTPGYDADNSKATIYAISFGEKAWPGMDTNGCNFMTCPIKNGVSNTYSYAVTVSPTYPRSTVPIRVVFTSNDEPKCCFITKIKIL